MPSSSDELRAYWGRSGRETAVELLKSRGFTLTPQWTWIAPLGQILSARDLNAIKFLIEEWDYGSIENNDAVQHSPTMMSDGIMFYDPKAQEQHIMTNLPKNVLCQYIQKPDTTPMRILGAVVSYMRDVGDDADKAFATKLNAWIESEISPNSKMHQSANKVIG